MIATKTAVAWFVWQNDIYIDQCDGDQDGGYEGISNMKMQKLLYFAQGIHLAITGKPLFSDPIEAWQHGPVVPDVYHWLKKFGSNSVEIEDTPDIINAIGKMPALNEQSLVLAYDNYAIYTAWQLRNITHKPGSPWDITVKTTGLNSIIPTNLIQEYFVKYVVE